MLDNLDAQTTLSLTLADREREGSTFTDRVWSLETRLWRVHPTNWTELGRARLAGERTAAGTTLSLRWAHGQYQPSRSSSKPLRRHPGSVRNARPCSRDARRTQHTAWCERGCRRAVSCAVLEKSDLLEALESLAPINFGVNSWFDVAGLAFLQQFGGESRNPPCLQQ